MKIRPRILVCNDDGHDAIGILALEQALVDLGEVWKIAPDRERSASSHAITVREDLQLLQVGERSFTLNGYPADCVNVGLFHLDLFPDFDIIVSGINHGPNLGDDVHYSGTVAAARQGAIHHIKKTIAISTLKTDALKTELLAANMERIAYWLAQWLGDNSENLQAGVVYNINFPEEHNSVGKFAAFPEVRFTYQGKRSYKDRYTDLGYRQGKRVLRLISDSIGHIRSDHSDFEAVLAGCISITPLSTYTTDIRELRKWQHKVGHIEA